MTSGIAVLNRKIDPGVGQSDIAAFITALRGPVKLAANDEQIRTTCYLPCRIKRVGVVQNPVRIHESPAARNSEEIKQGATLTHFPSVRLHAFMIT
jgi:hypothetical protein